MSNVIHTGQETEAEVRICPNCSSTALEAMGDGGTVGLPTWKCGTCNTVLGREDIIVSRFKHELGDDSDVLDKLVRSLRNTVAADLALSMGRFLLKWGFLDTPNPYLLSRYVNAVARAMLIAIIEERQKIEGEKHGR